MQPVTRHIYKKWSRTIETAEMLTATLITCLFLAAHSHVTSAVDRDYNFPPAIAHRPNGGMGGGGEGGGGEEGEKGVPDDPLGIWEDYGEEDPTNSCFLVSWEDSVKAAYLCQDGTLWQVNIQSEGDRCVYNRTVTNSFGEATNNEATINCSTAREWIQGLVQTDVIAGIPDTHFFNANNTNSLTLRPSINPSTDEPQQTPEDQGCT